MSKGRQRVELVRGDPWTSAIEVLDNEVDPSGPSAGLDVIDKLQFTIGIDLNGLASCQLRCWGLLTLFRARPPIPANHKYPRRPCSSWERCVQIFPLLLIGGRCVHRPR